MCSEKEQEGMVNAIKKAGWLRSTLVFIGMIFALVASVWTAQDHITGEAKEAADGCIQNHVLQEHRDIDKRLERIQATQELILEEVRKND